MPPARQSLPTACGCVLLDVETQWDFFRRGGNCYRWPESSAVAANIYTLFQWARQGGIPVMSTLLRVRPVKPGPLAKLPCCAEGSWGERKLVRTVLRERVNFGLRNSADLPPNVFQRYRQVIFEKRHTDLFSHTRAERLITELPPCTFVVCGAGVAEGIAQAAIGLRARGFAVVLARDAVLPIHTQRARKALLRMQAKGVNGLGTAQIAASAPDELGAATLRENADREAGSPVPRELGPPVESGIDRSSE